MDILDDKNWDFEEIEEVDIFDVDERIVYSPLYDLPLIGTLIGSKCYVKYIDYNGNDFSVHFFPFGKFLKKPYMVIYDTNGDIIYHIKTYESFRIYSQYFPNDKLKEIIDERC